MPITDHNYLVVFYQLIMLEQPQLWAGDVAYLYVKSLRRSASSTITVAPPTVLFGLTLAWLTLTSVSFTPW
jgi:hypothetical protein